MPRLRGMRRRGCGGGVCRRFLGGRARRLCKRVAFCVALMGTGDGGVRVRAGLFGPKHDLGGFLGKGDEGEGDLHANIGG